jgi:hypothetical protein
LRKREGVGNQWCGGCVALNATAREQRVAICDKNRNKNIPNVRVCHAVATREAVNTDLYLPCNNNLHGDITGKVGLLRNAEYICKKKLIFSFHPNMPSDAL